MALELTKPESADACASLRRYFRTELEQEISDLQAGMLLDYFMKEIGPLAYNCGVKDAELYFRAKVEDLPATCYENGLTYWTRKKR